MSDTLIQRHHRHDFVLRSKTQHGNPFLVELSAEFAHDSGETIAGLPGFYDGDRRWLIRFSPTREGKWRGITVSDDPELNDIALGPVRCVPNQNPRVHGRLGIAPADPRRFAFDDGVPFVPLGFECDWLFALHQADPQAFRDGVDLIAERGFNYVVTNIYAHTGFSEPGHEWVFGPPSEYVFGGTNESPDHSRLNPEFFRDFDRMLDYLHAEGIIAHLMIQVQNKQVRWPQRRSVEDDLYWRYVVARYQAYSNVVWDVGKECYNLLNELGSHEYTIDRIGLVRRTDAYRHLVTAHDTAADSAGQDSPADQACDFVCDQVHLHDVAKYNREAAGRFQKGVKPYMNIEYGYEEGVEPLPTFHSGGTRPWQDILLWTWAIYLGGGYACYYYSNTAWDLIKLQPEPPGWQRYRYLADFLALLNVNAMEPCNDLVERGFCLAEPGRQYLVFLSEGGDTNLALDGVPTRASVECLWMDIFCGERTSLAIPRTSPPTPLCNPLSDPSHPCAIAIRVRPEVR
jgi:hypothetical protein